MPFKNFTCGICSLLHNWDLPLVAELKLRHLDCYSAHSDCRTCLCINTESSTTMSINCGWAPRLCSAPAGPTTLNLGNFKRLLYRLDGQCLALPHIWDTNDRVDDTLRDTLLGLIWTSFAISSPTCGTGTWTVCSTVRCSTRDHAL